eukprot:229288-Prorocentrum_minimum.AAC.1
METSLVRNLAKCVAPPAVTRAGLGRGLQHTSLLVRHTPYTHLAQPAVPRQSHRTLFHLVHEFCIMHPHKQLVGEFSSNKVAYYGGRNGQLIDGKGA